MTKEQKQAAVTLKAINELVYMPNIDNTTYSHLIRAKYSILDFLASCKN